MRAAASSGRIAVRSGHKVGKSTSAVILALWWVCTRMRARVIMTSSSGRQVKSVLWKELRRIYALAKKTKILGGRGLGGTLHKVPDAGFQFSDGREILGFSTNEPEKMAGFSGPNIFYIVDEASGVPEDIFEAIEGNRAGGARICLFSNPTRTSGTFFDAFHRLSATWHTLRVSSEETPNASGKGPPIPGLATLAWIEEKRRDWGEGTPIYEVRVRGNFPRQSASAVIGLALVTDAVERHAETIASGRLELGVDPARFGDDESVVVARRGQKVLCIVAYQGVDGPTLASHVAALCLELRTRGEKPLVKIDPIGIGASPYDALLAYPDLEVVPVNAGESATEENFVRLRDQLWWAARLWLEEGGALPHDDLLEGELVAPTYGVDPRNRIKIQSKDELRKQIGRSPDRADALCLAVFETPPSEFYVPANTSGGYRHAS